MRSKLPHGTITTNIKVMKSIISTVIVASGDSESPQHRKRQLGAFAFKEDCLKTINRGGTAGIILVPGLIWPGDEFFVVQPKANKINWRDLHDNINGKRR